MQARRRWAAVSMACLVLLGPLTGCGLFADEQDEIVAVLEARARAVLDGDRAGYLKLVDGSDEDFLERQTRLFDNLAKLPVDRFGYELRGGVTVVGSGDGQVLRVHVDRALKLGEFDRSASVDQVAMSFVERDGRLLVAAPPAPSAVSGWTQPWDVTKIAVEESDQVLLVYEETTDEYLGGGVREIERAMDAVDDAFPLPWDHQTVVYLIDDEEVLAPIGMSRSTVNPGHVAGAVVPVLESGYGSVVASTRLVLNPFALETGSVARGRLVRHELTHEAMGFGIADDVWFAEGAAMYVAHLGIPRDKWPVTPEHLARARKGVEEMPLAWDMYHDDPATSSFNYALAMMACDYLVSSQGRQVLADLYLGMRKAGPDAQRGDQERVYERVLGFGSEELARRTARHMLSSFG